MKRYALVRGLGVDRQKVGSYLPANYRVIYEGREKPYPGTSYDETVVVIEGMDSHGWTLDAYISPRLGSGLMRVEEISLSHPIMAQIPEE